MSFLSRLDKVNYLNFLFYILNIVITYGVGNLGWLGTPTNGELSEKYQTLITPASRAFLIWSVIFLMQAIFAIAQLVPRIGGKAMVLQGVGYYYIATCIFQAGWTIAFAYEVIWLSMTFMVLIWLSLVSLVYSQYHTKSDQTLLEFWLLRFPFAIHCGWITAASALNVNVVIVDIGPAADIQLAAGIISLAVLHAISFWVLFGLRKGPNYTIAAVLAWANYFIYVELQDPKDNIVSRFSPDAISGVSLAAVAVSCIILLQIVVRLPFDLYHRCYNKVNDKEEEAPVERRQDLESGHAAKEPEAETVQHETSEDDRSAAESA